MKKKTLSLDKLRAAGQDASMNMNQKVSHAKQTKIKDSEIEITKIFDNPYQPRLFIEEDTLNDLANSIKTNGLLQPITLNEISDDKYHVIAGHRRLEAHKLLGKKFIKATVVTSLTEDNKKYKNKMITLALIENLQREDLNIIEIAVSFKNVMQEKIFDNMEELGKSIGKSKTYVSKVLKILRLDDYIIHDITKNKTIKDLEILYELQKIIDKELQVELYNSIIKGEMNRKDIKEYNKNTQKVSHAKHTKPFELKASSKKISLNTNLEFLSEDNRDKFSNELKNLLNKFFKNVQNNF